MRGVTYHDQAGHVDMHRYLVVPVANNLNGSIAAEGLHVLKPVFGLLSGVDFGAGRKNWCVAWAMTWPPKSQKWVMMSLPAPAHSRISMPGVIGSLPSTTGSPCRVRMSEVLPASP